jgi:hypothetical protein
METMRIQITQCRRLTALVALVLAACGGSTVTDQPAPTSPSDTTKPPTTTVQRGSVTVRVVLDPADSSLARQAGIGVNGLTVRLTSSRAGDPVRTAVTGADGTARFDNLLEASFSATVERRLTPDEVAKLAPGDRDASVFAGGGQTTLSPPASATATVAIVGARRGSVVISEYFASYGPLQYTEPNYVFGGYMEVYNNADTTAYLDGMMLATTVSLWYSSDLWDGPCTEHPKMLRLDSTAVYSSFIMAFPGTGRDYPIRPGEAKVVAMDAINHAATAPTKEQVDLSRAPFEQFYTDADVDNPESVNMVKVDGPASGIFGHGWTHYGGSLMYLLLSPGARAGLSTVTVPKRSATGLGTIDVTRIPSEFILDLMSLESTPYVYQPVDPTPRCVPWTSARYDRAPAWLAHAHQRKSITRKSLGFTADGREILQRTKNSERDLQWADPLKRSLNK